jgi:hypothetical protein
MIDFTNALGEIVRVNPHDVTIVESAPDYQVLQASVRSNPGEVLTKVVYNVGGESEFPDALLVSSTDDQDVFEEADLTQDAEDLDTMEEEAFENPRKASRMTWRNLRLQAAIDGQKGTTLTGGRRGEIRRGIAGAVKRLTTVASYNALSPNQSVREYPTFLQLASAEQWYDYVRNMNQFDVSAELSIDVAPQIQYSVYGFVKEWEMDPTHTEFRRRINPGADINSEIAKGQIAYDIMTGRAPDPMKGSDIGQHRTDKMFRLAFDIIRSIRMGSYNYYTLNQMHLDEGDRIFMEFRARYIPLEASEVEMVLEMQRKTASGKEYAFQTTGNSEQALEADLLMRKAVAAYEVGDTRSVRSIIEVLGNAPYNYKPMSVKVAAVSGMDDVQKASDRSRSNQIYTITANVNKIDRSGKYSSGNRMHISIASSSGDTKKDIANLKEGKLLNPDKGNVTAYTIHKGPNDQTPIGMLTKTGKEGKFWTAVDYAGELDKYSKAITDSKTRAAQRRLEKAVKSNPKGRGKYLYIEIHPRTQLELRKPTPSKDPKKTLELWSHGKYPSRQDKYTKGLHKFFGNKEKDEKARVGTLVKVGKLKKTGDEAPYLIRLPIHYFKRETKQMPDGRTINTIGIKKGSAGAKKAFNALIKHYGVPKHSPVKGQYYRFTIDKQSRGPYYDSIRAKVGKKSR